MGIFRNAAAGGLFPMQDKRAGAEATRRFTNWYCDIDDFLRTGIYLIFIENLPDIP